MLDEELERILVKSDISLWNPYLGVKNSIFDHSFVVMYFLHHDFELALKLASFTIKGGIGLIWLSSFSKLKKKSLNFSAVWLGRSISNNKK